MFWRVESTLLTNVGLDDLGQCLAHAVLDIDLLGLVTRGYGEEWEAYQEAGVITLLGAAFSRDQPEKIYIQDLVTGAHVQQDSADLLALSLLEGAVLDEGTERCETNHRQRQVQCYEVAS
jgi:hypothetical protein